ncbi:hypothetical protein EHQ68_11880 [Leptospira congkakensis]|uniref:Peptidase M50 domain-containing protein n=1 Tax=Leptospira congkakensis TaxID=2484932 RepID=A0A4Z1AFR6_9LEPT|nr:site-2 protease family protein [Leptospira congkakensis]TGL87249.1 hypothetical protein EHQ68_11880 [Leptospira congkakensis]TGL96816.1 hypothetical protein EHQ69_00825 [Leptospira congkakensis]TGL97666.1 hypothetical protein EHQ70_06480 [Leptospira congkakensis]
MGKIKFIVYIVFGLFIGIYIARTYINIFSLSHLFAGLLFLYISIYIHEFGHLLFAKLSHLKVDRIIIGNGKKNILNFKIFETSVSITNAIDGGFTYLDYHSMKDLTKLNYGLYLSGGILLNFFFFFVFFLINILYENQYLYGYIIVFYLINLFLVIQNLIPTNVSFSILNIDSDGMLLYKLASKGNQFINEIKEDAYISYNLPKAKIADDPNEYIELLKPLLSQYPENVYLNILKSSAKRMLLEFETSSEIAYSVLNYKIPNNFYLKLAYNEIACSSFFTGDPKGEEYSKMAVELGKNDPIALSTYGCLLIQNEKFKEGISTLQKSIKLMNQLSFGEDLNIVSYIFLCFAYQRTNDLHNFGKYKNLIKIHKNEIKYEVLYIFNKLFRLNEKDLSLSDTFWNDFIHQV